VSVSLPSSIAKSKKRVHVYEFFPRQIEVRDSYVDSVLVSVYFVQFLRSPKHCGKAT
jgi:hypothetical protein